MQQRLLSELSDQELEVELKKRKNERIFFGLFIGFLVGIAIWSATHKGGFWTFFILAFVFYIAKKNWGNFDEITNEINSRKVL